MHMLRYTRSVTKDIVGVATDRVGQRQMPGGQKLKNRAHCTKTTMLSAEVGKLPCFICSWTYISRDIFIFIGNQQSIVQLLFDLIHCLFQNRIIESNVQLIDSNTNSPAFDPLSIQNIPAATSCILSDCHYAILLTKDCLFLTSLSTI